MFEIPAGYQKWGVGDFGGMPNRGPMREGYGPPRQPAYGNSGKAPAGTQESGIANDVADAAVDGAEEAAVEETK